jgi:cell shape-determining protein MreD
VGTYGADLLGHGLALSRGHWFGMDCWNRAGCIGRVSAGSQCAWLVIIAYVTLNLHQRLRMFSALQQAGLVFAMVGINLMLNHWLEILTGQTVASNLLFLSAALTSAIIWPSMFQLLRHIRRSFDVH